MARFAAPGQGVADPKFSSKEVYITDDIYHAIIYHVT